jgi:hypothetical protein
MVSAFDVVALIIGIFFVVGIAVGFLIVMTIPVLRRIRAYGTRQLQQFHPDPADPGLPGQRAPWPGREPDDRDDHPWWPSQR